MADRLDVDTSSLRHAADRLRWVAGDLSRALDHVQSGTAGARSAMGRDGAGTAFAAGHDPVRRSVEDAVARLIDVVAGMADGLAVQAANLDDAEAANRTTLGGR